MSTASAVSICSNAIQRLGEKPIASFDEGTKHASTAANLWPGVRDALLRSHPWNCATKRTLLAPTAETPPFDYAHKFLLPGDWLKTLQVGRRGMAPDYQVEGRCILCSTTQLPLVYIARNENPATWDDSLVGAAELAMAAALAYPITASTSLRDSLLQEAQFVLRQAKAIDGQDSPPEEFEASGLMRARF
jgi:hypothetical protein